eukprot:gene17629-biopygen17837
MVLMPLFTQSDICRENFPSWLGWNDAISCSEQRAASRHGEHFLVAADTSAKCATFDAFTTTGNSALFVKTTGTSTHVFTGVSPKATVFCASSTSAYTARPDRTRSSFCSISTISMPKVWHHDVGSGFFFFVANPVLPSLYTGWKQNEIDAVWLFWMRPSTGDASIGGGAEAEECWASSSGSGSVDDSSGLWTVKEVENGALFLSTTSTVFRSPKYTVPKSIAEVTGTSPFGPVNSSTRDSTTFAMTFKFFAGCSPRATGRTDTNSPGSPPK